MPGAGEGRGAEQGHGQGQDSRGIPLAPQPVLLLARLTKPPPGLVNHRIPLPGATRLPRQGQEADQSKHHAADHQKPDRLPACPADDGLHDPQPDRRSSRREDHPGRRRRPPVTHEQPSGHEQGLELVAGHVGRGLDRLQGRAGADRRQPRMQGLEQRRRPGRRRRDERKDRGLALPGRAGRRLGGDSERGQTGRGTPPAAVVGEQRELQRFEVFARHQQFALRLKQPPQDDGGDDRAGRQGREQHQERRPGQVERVGEARRDQRHGRKPGQARRLSRAAPQPARLRHHPVARHVHPPPGEVGAEALLGSRPDAGRRRRVEGGRIGGERLSILVIVAACLARTAAGRSMVERFAEHVAAEGLPVVPRVGEMQVPGLVHILAGRHRMPGRQRQEHEPSILIHHADGVADRPAVLPGQPAREREPGRGVVEPVGENPIPQILLTWVDRHGD